jgi:hypothetical protein
LEDTMAKTPSRAASNTSGGTSPILSTKKSAPDADIDLKLDKIKSTPFSEAKDWESTVFELKLLLKQAWKDTSLDIAKYLTDDNYALGVKNTIAAATADQLIYYILSVGSVRGSFARNAIMAAQSTSAQPHIAENEGLALYKNILTPFSCLPRNIKQAYH